MPKKHRIYSLKNNSLNEQDRLDLARILLKAGYAVYLGREKKKSNSFIYYVEYWEETNEQN